jgi:hypothetical protein
MKIALNFIMVKSIAGGYIMAKAPGPIVTNDLDTSQNEAAKFAGVNM